MAQTVNYIGAEYRASFDSVIGLIESGCLSGSDLDLAVEGTGNSRRVVDRKSHSEFVCSRTNRRTEESPVAMDEEGATWFGVLRGEKREFPNSAWLALIDKVATAYHKRFSLVEYQSRKRRQEDERAIREFGKKFASRLIKLFYPDLGEADVAVPREASGDDIYGVSLRLGLSGGTGEAQPILSRVYFRRMGDTMAPLEAFTANQIETYISEAVLTDDGGERAPMEKSDGSVVRMTLNALSSLIDPHSGESRLAGCLCFPKQPDGRKSHDEIVIESLIRMTSNARNTLECKSIKVLGITHVKWDSTMLDVVSAHKPLFRIFFGPNNSVTLKCLACDSENYLIENNLIVLGEGENVRQIAIDPNREDLGLDSGTIKLLQEKVFSLHLERISCPIRGGMCEKFACRSRTVEVKEGVNKCAKCPYPEVIWTDEKGRAHVTSDLVFAADRMTLVEKKDAEKCVWCGRGFTLDGMADKRKCVFCSTASLPPTGVEKRRAEMKYRQYSGMLPLGVRLFAVGKSKYCYDDDGVILFVVGGKGYLLNKLDLRDEGMLPSVKRLGHMGET